MNIRSLTRGDGAVIGAAVLLFIASFLKQVSFDCGDAPESACDAANEKLPNAWDGSLFPVLPAIFLLGVIAALLVVISRFLPSERKVAGLALDQWGTALAVSACWSALFSLFTGPGRADNDDLTLGLGAILGFLATLIMALGALLNHLVPAMAAPLIPASSPRGPQPYGGQPQPGYGYPGGPQPGYGYPGPGGQQQPYGGQPHPGQQQPHPGQPHPGQPHPGQPQPGQQQPHPGQRQPHPGQPGPAGAPDPQFQPFWFAVPVARPLFGEDGSPTPVAELAPGNWYLAVEQRGQALIAQTQDGRRGVLQDTTGIQRG